MTMTSRSEMMMMRDKMKEDYTLKVVKRMENQILVHTLHKFDVQNFIVKTLRCES